jgi:hypothetical protein
MTAIRSKILMIITFLLVFSACQKEKGSVRLASTTTSTLKSLSLSSGALSPEFASGTIAYTASVALSVSSITVKPAVTNTKAKVKVNGTAVSSGSASAAIDLDEGSNSIIIVVTAEDGVSTSTTTYTITVIRAGSTASTGPTLTSLSLSSGSLSPAFASGTTSYTASVGNTVSSITIAPSVKDAGAKVKVNGVAVNSGSASAAINLNVGVNIITILVTAENGTSTSTYTVTVTRSSSTSPSGSALASLSLNAGTLSPAFAAGITSYTASVENAVASITVTPLAGDATATIKVNGTAVTSGSSSASINLTEGTNTITIISTSGSNTTTYTITVTRAAAASVDGLSFKINGTTKQSTAIDASLDSGTLQIAAELSASEGVQIIIINPKQGTFSLTPSSGTSAIILYNFEFVSVSGSLVITSFTSTSVKGTFSGSVSDGATTKQITAGVFETTYTK